MKKHTVTILLISAMLIGLSLLLYPSFSDWWNSFHQSRAIATYSKTVEALDPESCQAVWNEAEDYNAGLLERPNSFLLSQEQKETYRQLLDAGGNGIMGYVEIPSISVRLPIYHGTEEGVLQVAAGHLEWPSLPVGGESSHCVISGHRGLPSARLFTDLDEVEEGDLFRLHVLDQVLTYQVDQILVVEPQDTEELMIREGEDLCTLVTCTPYGINSHRMLVRGKRVENPETEAAVTVLSSAVRLDPAAAAPVAAIPILAVLLILWLLPRKKHGGDRDEST